MSETWRDNHERGTRRRGWTKGAHTVYVSGIEDTLNQYDRRLAIAAHNAPASEALADALRAPNGVLALIGHAEHEADQISNWTRGKRASDAAYELRKTLRELRLAATAFEALLRDAQGGAT